MSPFDPNVTQRVIAQAKEDTAAVKFAFWKSHRQDFLMFYGYFVGACMTVQAYWPEMIDYVPPAWRRIIMGSVTMIVLADKLIRNKPSRVDPQ